MLTSVPPPAGSGWASGGAAAVCTIGLSLSPSNSLANWFLKRKLRFRCATSPPERPNRVGFLSTGLIKADDKGKLPLPQVAVAA